MNSELANQSVIVVGGTSCMGLAIARLAKSRGASVTVASRSSDKVAAVATELGSAGKPIDTSDEASVRDFFAEVGPVDHQRRVTSVVCFALDAQPPPCHNFTLGNKTITLRDLNR